MLAMASFRVGQAARLLGVSVDTVRRHIDAGRLASQRTDGGQRLVDGADLARLAAATPPAAEPGSVGARSPRNRLTGLVTGVTRDGVMAQVELQAGPHRIVSLMSREAAEELGLEPGMLAVASVKATMVGIDLPAADT